MRNNSQVIPRYWNARTHTRRAGTFSCPGTTHDTNASRLLLRPWKVSETDLGRRAETKQVSLKTTETNAKEEKLTSCTKEEEEKLQQLFKEDIATGAINEGELNKKVSTTNLLKVRSFRAIVLKLRRISAEQRKDISLPSEKMTSTEKVSSSLSSNRLEGDVFGPVNAPTKSESNVSGPVNATSLPSDFSWFWRKFTDEQTSYVHSLTKDLVENDSVKREIVWEWVRNDSRSQELGLITSKEDEKELMKCKQTNSYSAHTRKTVTTQRENKKKNKIYMLI